jgi:hypothetical protein
LETTAAGSQYSPLEGVGRGEKHAAAGFGRDTNYTPDYYKAAGGDEMKDIDIS